jgi:hypothetical protein
VIDSLVDGDNYVALIVHRKTKMVQFCCRWENVRYTGLQKGIIYSEYRFDKMSGESNQISKKYENGEWGREGGIKMDGEF